MRLIEKLDTCRCSPDEVVVLVRHGVDLPVLSKELNQPLTEETKSDIRILGGEMIELCGRLAVKNVYICHSNRLRAIQTGIIMTEAFHSANIPVEIVEAVGIREIYQGDFLIKDHSQGSEYKPLVDAWRVWQRKLDESELLYRFGDPILDEDGKAQHPELTGWFKEFGEHQGEFSLRLYLLLKEMFDDNKEHLQIIIGHQASSSRIQRIFDAVSKIQSPDEFVPGEFVRFIEKRGSRIPIDPACGVVLKKPDRGLVTRVLQKEIDYLKSIV
ncbi:MAG: hypothetical protein WAX85_02450 [Minisyncoccia bacterium]